MRGPSPGAAAVCVAAVLAVAMAGALVHAHAGEDHGAAMPAEYANLRHPQPGAALMLFRGQRLYAENCASCHGPRGGEVEEARFDDAAFVDEMDDAFLYWRISDGVPGTDMDPWKDLLSPHDRWSLVSYLRALPALGAALDDPEVAAALGAGGEAPAAVAGLRAQNAALQVQLAEMEAALMADSTEPSDTPAAAPRSAVPAAPLAAGAAGLFVGVFLGIFTARAGRAAG